VAFVPRIDKRQPDIDFLHYTGAASARVDTKNRKSPWIHLVVLDLSAAAEVPSLVMCKKGAVLLARAPPPAAAERRVSELGRCFWLS